MNSRTIALISLVSLAVSGCVKHKSLESLRLEQLTPPPDIITFKMTGYAPPTGRVFKDFFVMNFSIKPMQGNLLQSTSRDGIPDDLKIAKANDYGFSPISPYSTNPYFSDLMLYLSGIVLTQQGNLFCPDAQRNDATNTASNDAIIYTDDRTIPQTRQFLGLRDCEKQYLGLDPNSFDFDGDGLPDYLELRCGLNPKNKYDVNTSPAGDGMTALEKCKRNLPFDESANSQANKLFGYQYKQDRSELTGMYTFTVSNVPIINQGQDQFFAFYLTEMDQTSLKTYLYTAYAKMLQATPNKTYTFPYWATRADPNDTSKNFNQEVTF